MTFALLRRRKDLPLSHVRLIALALLAVLLPALILLYLQYQSLTEVHKKTRFAVEEDLREAAQSMAWKILGDMERLAQDALLPAPARFFEQHTSPWTAAQLDATLRSWPQVKQFFLVAEEPLNGEHEGVAYFYSRQKTCTIVRSEWADVPEIEQAVQAHHKSDLLYEATAHATTTPAWDTKGLLFWQETPRPGDPDGEEAGYVTYCLLEPGSGREVGFIGFALNMEEVRQRYLPELISKLWRTHQDPTAGASLILGVFDQRGNQICASIPSETHYEVRSPLAPVFPQWEVAAGFQGTSIDALAHASFKRELWFTVLVFAILLAGITMILRAAARELRLAEAKSTFVSNVSHELKTPLALIRLFAETLELGRAKTEEKAREYYRIIHNESRRLSQLIDNILDFSRIEAGSREYSFVSTDLAEVTCAVVSSYEYQIRAAGFELVRRFDPGLPLVQADPNAISQAILNLLNNAVKYSDRTKHITVHVRAKDDGVAVEVTDRGIGIPLSEQRKIFEKFYRVSTGLVHETKGSGLGLALVKHIVDAHHGRVTVESASGRGSCFTLWLPAATAVTDGGAAEAGEGDFVAQSLNH